MRPLWQVADFFRKFRRQMRFGELSRAPLQLLRVELCDGAVACDWIVRAPDAWDSTFPPAVREQSESLQALADAIVLRNLVFDTFRDIDTAVLRGFRQPAREPPEMVLLGTLSRESPEVWSVSSLAMRAKLYGFCFNMEDGVLRPMQMGDRREELIS